MTLLKSTLVNQMSYMLCLLVAGLAVSGCDKAEENGDGGDDTHGHDTEHEHDTEDGDDTEGDGEAVLEWASEHPPTSVTPGEDFVATFTVETDGEIHVTELRACMGEVVDCGLGGMESFDANTPATEAGGEYSATMSLPTAGVWSVVAYAHVGSDPFIGQLHTITVE